MLVVMAGQTTTDPRAAEVWSALPQTMAQAQGPVHAYVAPRAGHLDLSDVGLLARPVLLRQFFGSSQIGTASVVDTLRATSAVSVVFLDRYLLGRSSADPNQVAERASVLEIATPP